MVIDFMLQISPLAFGNSYSADQKDSGLLTTKHWWAGRGRRSSK
jgi:hypothetical protein